MVENHDIDALLIGALYGELTPADEARLSAHLESHPGDRSALDDLTRARAAVRDSQIFAVQLDPPQAVSALLLQEAARRAPKRVTRRDGSTETEGWFARFVRSFASHPGVAAAAMLVVVIGVAGTMYLRKGDPYVDKVAPMVLQENQSGAYKASPEKASADEAAPATATPDPNVAANPASQQPAATPPKTELAKELQADKSQISQLGSATAYDVKLDGIEAHRGAKGGAIAAGPTGNGQKDSSRDLGGSTGGDGYRNAAPAHAAVTKPSRALEVSHSEPSPKELADNDQPNDTSVAAKGDARGARDSEQQRPLAGKAGAAGTTSRFASDAKLSEEKPTTPAPTLTPRTSVNTTATGAPAPAAAPPPPPVANAPAASRSKAAPPKVADKLEAKTVEKTAPGAGAAPAQAPRADDSAEAKKEKQRSPDDARAPDAKRSAPADDQLVAWAKSRHASAQGLAKDGKCQDVGTIIADLAQRAPDYYNQFVATDRSLKQCQAYIAREREKNADKASKSRAPAPAPSADESMH